MERDDTCVIIPTYNNAATLGGVIRSVAAYTPHILVVNDGSTDQTQAIIDSFPFLKHIGYEKNRGKGWALRKATDSLNNDREAAVKIVAREMKTDEALTRDIMALNIYSMEMTEKIHRGMGEFVDFLHSLERIKEKFPAERVFYTKLLEEVDQTLVKWKAKTEVK